jgi:hypothetical protein
MHGIMWLNKQAGFKFEISNFQLIGRGGRERVNLAGGRMRGLKIRNHQSEIANLMGRWCKAGFYQFPGLTHLRRFSSKFDGQDGMCELVQPNPTTV